MPDQLPHPSDAAAMREPDEHDASLRQDVSNAVATLYKRYFGRGPADCRTYLQPDLVVLVLTGGFSASERTLLEAGRWHEVRSARLAWQDTMEARFVETIERLTRREVKAFMSANHQDPDLSVELFVLEPEVGAQRRAADAPPGRGA